jgi:hypothetical protein
LVRFDEDFVLSAAQPVPSNINHEPGMAQTNEYVQGKFAENELHLMCLLRVHNNYKPLNWKSCCRSSKFTVGLKTILMILYSFSFIFLFLASRYHPVKRNSEGNAQHDSPVLERTGE